MAGTEKELILLGLFLIVAVNEDSAVVSGAILSYKHRRHLHPLSELKTCSTRVTNPVNYGVYETASFLHLTITISIRFSELAPWQSNPLAIERIEHDVARRIRPRL